MLSVRVVDSKMEEDHVDDEVANKELSLVFSDIHDPHKLFEAWKIIGTLANRLKYLETWYMRKSRASSRKSEEGNYEMLQG